MTIIFVMFCIIVLYKMELCYNNKSYTSMFQTTNINGIFVFLIFLSHFTSYIDSNVLYSNIYLDIRNFLGQLVVVTFLFFSGYGMFESYKRLGNTYIDKIPKRFLRLLFKFDMAIILYLLLSLILQNDLNINNILLSFIAWEGLGNSYWYVFVVLSLYFLMYVTFKLSKNMFPKNLVYFTIASIILICLFIYVGKSGAWYIPSLSLRFL